MLGRVLRGGPVAAQSGDEAQMQTLVISDRGCCLLVFSAAALQGKHPTLHLQCVNMNGLVLWG